MGRQPASDPMVLEAGLLSSHRGAMEQSGTSPSMVVDCWVSPRFEQDPTSLGEANAGGQPALDEAGLLSGPHGATTPLYGTPGNGKDGHPFLGHEVASESHLLPGFDVLPTTAGQADHAGATVDWEGTEVPP